MATSIPHVEVLTPGSRLTIQDLGRRGSQRFGVSVSGVLDLQAAVVANRLVGNPATSAVFESTFGGTSLVFDADTKVAVTGADVAVDIDGFSVSVWETLIVPANAALNVSAPMAGLYAYIAFAGGLDMLSVLGFPLDTRRLWDRRFGWACIDIRRRSADWRRNRRKRATICGHDPTWLGNASVSRKRANGIRVTAGPQFDAFDDDSKSRFFASEFIVSNLTDRQGARLDGAEIPAIGGKHDIVSDPAYMGAVQVPTDGKPIILLADRQPTGGYAKIASVISADLPLRGTKSSRFEDRVSTDRR